MTRSLCMLALLLMTLPVAAEDAREPRFKVDPDLPPADWVLRPAEVKTPEQSIATFDLPPGFRAEVVAAEPIVQDPIAIAFAPDGRIWVIEYPAYNWEYRPKLDLPDEPPPPGRVVILEDTTGDGRMDRRTVFLDDLDNPRGLSLVGDGVLVGQPPELWFYRDTTGDGRADDRQKLFDDYGPLATVHAQPSGLLRAMDNWIYSTRFTARLRWHEGRWRRDEPVIPRGQWGLSQDNSGRLFYNTQADPLRGDLVPPAYWRRNPNLQDPAGLNVRFAEDLRGVKAHDATPGVNQRWDGFLNPMGKLVHFTSAGSPSIYRGQQFPPDLVGDAFVCVPAGNFVRHYRLTRDTDGSIEARNAYEDHEFLFAHDERFRPVQAGTGPDGVLYLVDMYRGIIEGHTWISDITHDYIIKRELHQPFNGLGRIYRIVHEDRPLGDRPDLADQTPPQWVNALDHPNGWRRDTAQRLLVENGADQRVIRPLRRLALDHTTETYARLHALWTLQGLDALSPDTVTRAMRDPAHHVRAAALRLAEPWIDEDDVLSAATALVDDEQIEVRRQLLFTLGESTRSDAETAMRQLLLRHGGEPWMPEAAVSGLHDREPRFLRAVLQDPAWQDPPAGADRLVRLLAHAITNEGDPMGLALLAELLSREEGWWRSPILAGLADGQTANLARSPRALRLLLDLPDPALRERATAVVTAIEIQPDATAVDPETLEEPVRQLYERGRTGFLTCAACHQTDGRGFEGVAPPLVGSPWLERDPRAMIRIALHGYSNREEYPPMAPLVGLNDDQLAAILTYVRLTLSEDGTPVHPEQVERIRRQPRDSNAPWTREQLEALLQ